MVANFLHVNIWGGLHADAGFVRLDMGNLKIYAIQKFRFQGVESHNLTIMESFEIVHRYRCQIKNIIMNLLRRRS